MRPADNNRRTAFTLVELLVVIAIIGILAAILIPTLAAAIKGVQEGAITFELNQLQMAFEQYKNANGQSYPIDFSTEQNAMAGEFPAGVSTKTIPDPTPPPPLPKGSGKTVTRLGAHLRKISIKYATAELTDPMSSFLLGIDTSMNPGNQPTITPDEALVFWLRRTRTSAQFPLTGDGIYDDPAISVDPNMAGVYPDPGVYDFVKDTCRTYFEFDPGRLVDFDGDGYMSYVPKYGPAVPYVYFHSSTYLTASLDTQDLLPYSATNTPIPEARVPDTGESNVALPYANSNEAPTLADVVDFHGEESFQIVWCGYDADFGNTADYATVAYDSMTTPPTSTFTVQQSVAAQSVIKAYPKGTNFSKGDRDNFGSFASGRLDKELEN